MFKKILYLDNTYPKEWLENRIKILGCENLKYRKYKSLVNLQRAYLSDYIPFNLSKYNYNCDNIVCNNILYLKKADKYYKFTSTRDIFFKLIKELIAFYRYLFIHNNKEKYYSEWKLIVLDKVIKLEKPEYIIVREPISIPSDFWRRYKNKSKIIAYIGVNISHPNKWNPFVFEGIITIIPTYFDFFKLQEIKSKLFKLGVESRLIDELKHVDKKKYDVTFCGLLGTKTQFNKTLILEYVAFKLPRKFKWWAPENVNKDKFPNLYNSYQGLTAGIDMLQILKESKIALNLYVETAGGLALNMRMYEILNVGTFPLVKYAENLEKIFPGHTIDCFSDEFDCVEKINYWLDEKNEKEREQKALHLSTFALQNLNYSERVKDIVDLINEIEDI